MKLTRILKIRRVLCPDGIDMYIAFYQDGELQKDAIKLDTENGYSFNYKITPSATDGDIVTFESVVDDKK